MSRLDAVKKRAANPPKAEESLTVKVLWLVHAEQDRAWLLRFLPYVRHNDSCAVMYPVGLRNRDFPQWYVCTCGLDALLNEKEITDG